MPAPPQPRHIDLFRVHFVVIVRLHPLHTAISVPSRRRGMISILRRPEDPTVCTTARPGLTRSPHRSHNLVLTKSGSNVRYTKLKIAVFIDFDNVEIGVKTTLNLQFDIGAVLEAIKERGEVDHQGRLRRLETIRRARPRHGAACRPHGAARDDARRRQERRRHQPRARRARDGVHALAHQRVRDRRRRQRLHHPRRKTQAVRPQGVRGRRPRLHQPGDAEELHRVHRLRERRPGSSPVAPAAPGRRASGREARQQQAAARSRSSWPCRSSSAR